MKYQKTLYLVPATTLIYQMQPKDFWPKNEILDREKCSIKLFFEFFT